MFPLSVSSSVATTTTSSLTTTTKGLALSAERLALLCTVFAVVLSFGTSEICSTEDYDGPISAIQMVLRSQLVLYGRIVKTFVDETYGTGVYTAEMHVYCVIKGLATAKIINITRAGYIPGGCYSTELISNNNYIVLAQVVRGEYRPVDTEISATSAKLEEVSKACRIDPKYPVGVREHTDSVSCPRALPPSECIDEDYFTTTSTTTTTIGPTDYDDHYDECSDPDSPCGNESDFPDGEPVTVNGVATRPPSGKDRTNSYKSRAQRITSFDNFYHRLILTSFVSFYFLVSTLYCVKIHTFP